MLLLGGFQLSPVPQNNMEKATSQLNKYYSGFSAVEYSGIRPSLKNEYFRGKVLGFRVLKFDANAIYWCLW